MTNKPNTTVKIVPESKDVGAIKQLEHLLSKEASQPRLVGSNGEEIPLPEPVYKVLCDVLSALSAGRTIHVVCGDGEFTTQEAADFLNISRPSLIKILKEGKIPHSKTGAHRRIRFQDLESYKERRDTERRSTLREFTSFLQEEGFYDYDVDDSDC